MGFPSFEQVHTVMDSVVTAIIPFGIWWFHRSRKAEAERIEAIADRKAQVIKNSLDEHEIQDEKRFSEHSEEARAVMQKLGEISRERQAQHLENQEKLKKLEDVPANMQTLMAWFKASVFGRRGRGDE
jgi:hypothetical protein